jgi:ceramide glucosyltransferase
MYRGVAGGGLAAMLEALWISTDFHVGVLVARLLGIPFALGATMALRRSDLDSIGGFGPLAAYLADDYLLGQALRRKGARIMLCDYVVETMLPRESWRSSWRHRIRWNRTLRACRPGGYAGLLVTFAVPLGIGAVAISPALWPLAIACCSLRLLTGWVVGWSKLQDRAARLYIWLLPLSDVFSFLLWIASFFGRRVEWRGAQFELEPDGRLKAVP